MGRDYTSLWAVGGFPGGSAVKNPPTLQETQETGVPSRARGNPLEEGMDPAPVFLPGQFHGQRSLAHYSPRGRRELGMTEETAHALWAVEFGERALGGEGKRPRISEKGGV